MIVPDLQAAARRVSRPVLTRFAPSPTGYLHLGHVVNAIYVWGMAQALGGGVHIRIEDHDRIRSRAAFEDAILDDLAWLGFVNQPVPPEVTRQRDRAAFYAEAVDALRSRYQVYACDCSRAMVGAGTYPGRCRNRNLADGPGLGLRLRIDAGAEQFEDLLHGPATQEPERQCGDLLLRDRDGHWTYQFAVVVDDLLQSVSLVIRGADLLPSTGRQLRLARMLRTAWPVAARASAGTWTYLHHPLIYAADGRKLSKTDGATGVRALRQSGVSPDEVIGRAAAAVGLAPSRAPVRAQEVRTLLDVAQAPLHQ